MTTFLTIIHVIVCVFLVLVVLLQAGKGGGMGIAFGGGGGSQTVFGRPGQPAELASIYVQLAAADASFATGQVYGSAGGTGQP